MRFEGFCHRKQMYPTSHKGFLVWECYDSSEATVILFQCCQFIDALFSLLSPWVHGKEERNKPDQFHFKKDCLNILGNCLSVGNTIGVLNKISTIVREMENRNQ